LYLSIVQGPFSVAPYQTLISQFATFSSLYGGYPWGGTHSTLLLAWRDVGAHGSSVVRVRVRVSPDGGYPWGGTHSTLLLAWRDVGAHGSSVVLARMPRPAHSLAALVTSHPPGLLDMFSSQAHTAGLWAHPQILAQQEANRLIQQAGRQTRCGQVGGREWGARSPNVELIGCQSVRQWLSFLGLRTVVRA
jgi:hypothetical protein